MAAAIILGNGRELLERLVTGDSPLPQTANAGLIWDRYLPMWTGSPDAPQRIEPPARVLERLVLAFNGRGNGPRNLARDLLRFHHERLKRAAEGWSAYRSRQLRILNYKVNWRLATGLGTDHPTENGFSFDSLIGVPYLPGSSVKGLCRRAAIVHGLNAMTIAELFGPERTEADEYGAQGKLIFLDAYPKRWPKLAVDIVNCHHPDYYRNPKPGSFPHETEDPVPVFFLTVDRDSEFTFYLIAPTVELDTAEQLLTQGLNWLGIGAKTAVGYGIMAKSS